MANTEEDMRIYTIGEYNGRIHTRQEWNQRRRE